MSERLPHLLFVVGPTASGKSDLAIEIAQKSGRAIELINCDSIQFFAGVDIGAAKPTPEELRMVPHHLIGQLPLGAEFTAGDFRRAALEVMEEGVGRKLQQFIAVGGSGFYVQALEKGMYDVPVVAPGIRETLEIELRSIGAHVLHRELSERDPEAAARIQPNDHYRVVRALEILRSSPGKTLSEQRAEFEKARPPAPFSVAKIGLRLSRERLRERITQRTEKMLQNGLIEETEKLRSLGYKNWAPLLSVGYKEVQNYLDGNLSREELAPLIITSTMQLAKRQMTWFKRDPEIRWFDAETERPAAVEYAVQNLIQNLSSDLRLT